MRRRNFLQKTFFERNVINITCTKVEFKVHMRCVPNHQSTNTIDDKTIVGDKKVIKLSNSFLSNYRNYFLTEFSMQNLLHENGVWPHTDVSQNVVNFFIWNQSHSFYTKEE